MRKATDMLLGAVLIAVALGVLVGIEFAVKHL
jgi:hypothetical protein